MPVISKIRFTNVIYESGEKRYNDDIFNFDGCNGAFLLENGGGKTVFVQTVIQAIIPNAEVAERKIKDTLMLVSGAAHVAVEWILNERPRRYALTAVTLFEGKNGFDCYRYVYEYDEGDSHSIQNMPFVKEGINGGKRAATKEEVNDYYNYMQQNFMNAHVFSTNKSYHEYIEENFKIFPSEWRNIALINGVEGGVEAFFDGCKTTGQLVDNLLIPVVEEAMSGEGAKDFAGIFDKQREHFKKYRQLKNRIDESKMVDAQIDGYVKTFSIYDESMRSFEIKKEKAKTFYNLMLKQKKILADRKQQLKNEIAECEKLKGEIERKEESYNLAVLNEKLSECKSEFDNINWEYEEKNKEFEIKEKKLQNLNISKLRKLIKDKEELISSLKNQIENMDKDINAEEIKINLDENSSFLRGYYLKEENKLEEEKADIEVKRNSLEKQHVEMKNDLNNKNNKKNNINSELTEENTKIKQWEIDMQNISKKILSNPIYEKVEVEYKKWNEEVTVIQKSIPNYQLEMNKLKLNKSKLIDESKDIRGKLIDFKTKITENQRDFDNIQKQHDKLLVSLKDIFSYFETYTSLYLKQATILQQVENKVESLRNQRDQLLINERLAHRYLDDYKENNYYTADPLFLKICKDLEPNFKSIESGTCYVKRAANVLNKDLNELYNLYPYWAATIIVSDGEEDKLINKLNDIRDKINYPVLIIEDKKARSIVNGEIKNNDEYKWIYPILWQSNINEDNFTRWKMDMEERAKDTTIERDKKEKELNYCKEILNDLRVFFNEYSYDYYLELKKNIDSCNENYRNLEDLLNKNELEISSTEKQIENYQSKINDMEQHSIALSSKIIRAQEYFDKKKQIEISRGKKFELENELKELINEIQYLEIVVKSKADNIESVKDNLRSIQGNIKMLKAETLYNEVMNYKEKYSEIDKNTLELKRRELQDELNKIQKDRKAYEDNIKEANKDKDGYNFSLNQAINMAKYKIENLDFPTYGEEDIEKLCEKINFLKEPLNILFNKNSESKRKYDRINDKYSYKKEDFYKKFDQIEVFEEPLVIVNENLKCEKEKVLKEEKYLNGQEERLNKEENDTVYVITELEKKNEKHGMLREDVKCVQLSDDEEQNLYYKKMEYVKEISELMDKLNDKVIDEYKKVEEYKSEFIKFCEEKILDPKLREMAAKGIEYKKNYEDILNWQRSIKERINKSIEIAQADIVEHDKELQQFINYLHTYLVSMAEEIRMIPKKTRIKTDDTVKEVFIFNVPNWDENDGKEEIAKHIDWMLRQLEQDKYRDEQGNEDIALVKKDIEKWLNPKQLLKIVMKNQEIKVKCRKVTNDGKINSAPFSWEVSNSWSGGEKWSKNMTLFLGILNYLAEKRKFILSKEKRQRTVILDNPFGKASSNHVLDPVFIIAEQLGFQIIALTAHAEGDFIRKYFPIVYSCRLRNVLNDSRQIMTKEREIKYAYLRDYNPTSLLNFEAQEQISFLGK